MSKLRQSIWKTPGLRQIRESGMFNTFFRRGFGEFWGHFQTSEEARTFMEASHRGSHDTDDIVQFNIERFYGIQFFDWPVLFFLQTLLREDRLHVVTDFGGHVGVKFYAYRELLDLPSDFQWQVFDVPAMVAEGRRRLSPEATSLCFFDDLGATAPCDALICSGVLQYADYTIDQILARLPGKPQTVIVNKVAVFETEGFYTLQNYGRYWLPYHIVTPKELEEDRIRLGYRLVADWTVPREIVVNSGQGRYRVKTIGQAWRL